MSNRLAGKTALVTGAAQGIGRAASALFAAEGASVWATDRNEAGLAGLDGCTLRRLDLLDPAEIGSVFAEAGPLDILFNCAGHVAAGALLECSEADWALSFDLNVGAMFRTIRAALPAMLEKGGGSIINMASVAGSVTGVPNRCAYGASKAAVIGLTKSIAADYVGQGIRCNAIAPGTVDTLSLHQRLRDTGDYEASLSAFNARQPMGRFGRPEEIAALAVYLASDESGFTTGQVHVVDGGWTT
ncbi:MAG: NAD(P)-dependent oxidoreductase [Alphaproteobacteria bacterium]|nr:NAD(P)-dependent oxidoreductase [Alphaproteobacteria bacterium]MDB5720303.1 NAD(P)-dependent oxidoreductase [Alphaproteobacteria bacterium]